MLRTLLCPSCGAALPIGDGDEACCHHCDAVHPLPDEYRALRDAARSDARAVVAAERLYQRLTMPAGAIARRLSSDALGAKMAAAVLPMALCGFTLWGTRIHLWLSARLHRNLFQTVDWWTLFAAHLGAMLLVILPLFIWLTLGARYAAARSLLREALGALPPATPGGPSLCRRCGAPLTVASGAFGAACLYCRAHNLLQPAEHHRWDARQLAIAGAMDDAAQLEAWERRTVRASMLQRSAVVLALLVIAIGFYSLTWPRQLRPRWTTWQKDLERRTDEQLSLRLDCRRSEGYYRGKDWCQSRIPLALRHGERVSFRLIELPVGAVTAQSFFDYDRADGRGQTLALQEKLHPGEAAPLLTVDEGGYYDFFFDFFQTFERETHDDQLRTLWVPVELSIRMGETNQPAGPLPKDPAAAGASRHR